MAPVPVPTPIYHFTHIDNFESLLQSGDIYSKKRMNEEFTEYKSVANDEIQGHRNRYDVPVEPYGTIHDYVPFYFSSLSPMLYKIRALMNNLVIFQSTAQIVESEDKRYVFTDGHGIMELTDYYNDLSDLDEIDWEVFMHDTGMTMKMESV